MAEGMHPRVVAIGDLNGAVEALRAILQGTGVADADGRWTGGTATVVQVGDVWNRGDHARAATDLLRSLRAQARQQGGDVIMLVGNHEVMTATGVEAYCTIGEYLSFASRREREAWPARRQRALRRLYRRPAGGGPIPPLAPRLSAWEAENAPGRTQMRRAFGPRGRVGRELRRMPVAVRIGRSAFVHAGLNTRWSRLGVDGLNAAARSAWRAVDATGRADRRGVLGDPNGPLWNRRLVSGTGGPVERTLERVLEHLGAERLVVGHTSTAALPGGLPGRVLSRFDGRLLAIDTGIHDTRPERWSALVLDRHGVREWTPSGLRSP